MKQCFTIVCWNSVRINGLSENFKKDCIMWQNCIMAKYQVFEISVFIYLQLIIWIYIWFCIRKRIKNVHIRYYTMCSFMHLYLYIIYYGKIWFIVLTAVLTRLFLIWFLSFLVSYRKPRQKFVEMFCYVQIKLIYLESQIRSTKSFKSFINRVFMYDIILKKHITQLIKKDTDVWCEERLFICRLQ